jgi:ribulose-5-phosphate 4-epimerase/fuculose-1-phosphate aldolase
MSGHDIRDDVARVCRVLAVHEMIDLWGHVSTRIPKSELILTTPRFSRRCLPRYIRARDLLVCDAAGRVVEGNGELPTQFAADLALYRKNTERQACMFAAPRTAMAAAISRYTLIPLTHMESATGYDLALWESTTLADAPGSAEQLAALAVRATAVHHPGVGVWAAGKDVFDCLTTLYHLEYLAQANLVAAGDAAERTVRREDSDKLWRQFSGHHHYHEFYASLDPGTQEHPYETFVQRHSGADVAFAELKLAMAFSCRGLWARDTLVQFLEHVSHRLPQPNRFLMTASKNFHDMEATDVCLLDLEANWIDGPRPPGFKWFHAQLLSERKDAIAVVHTHDLFGRAYAASGRKPGPTQRLGLAIGTREIPVYGRCDLIVDPDVRRQTLDALGQGPVVHELGHGTDFVADTLEKATVDAIQREAFLAMDHLSRQFGEPRALPSGLAARIGEVEASAEDWWWLYMGEVDAPRRSVAGL